MKNTNENGMNENNVISFPPPGHFSRDAMERWNKIPKSAQVLILANVWCGGCSGTASIVLESAEMERCDLILRGKCKTCGHEVCRAVEPEND
ncbi:MAG: hypothetical protein HW390_2638 [Candidatus Brocadiaceae bacterium]|nr:hypothetical protein [Candidatus Brocadiaceae bacterium]